MENDAIGYAMDGMRPRFATLAERGDPAARAVSAWQLFQTPEPLAARLITLADIRPGHAVLEPSAGLGRLLDPLKSTHPAGCGVTACEIDPTLCGHLFDLFPGVRLWQGDFLAREARPEFDRIVMNPPFHLRADITHVRHALAFLRPGGVLAGLCMGTRHREEALRPLADYWEPLPRGTFREAGTDVATVLFRISP